MEKKCSRCSDLKLFTEFNRDKSSKDGYEHCCRPCRKEKYQSRRLKILEQKQKYHIQNKNKRLFYMKEYYSKNKKEKNLYNKKYHSKNKEKLNKASHDYYVDNNKTILEGKRTLHRKDPRIELLKSSKRRATKKKLVHDLCLEDIKIPKQCPVLNIPISVSNVKFSDNSITIDRVDNNKGYTKDNIMIVSWAWNRMKGTSNISDVNVILKMR